MYGLADLRKFGEFSDRYSGECTVIEYTYKLSRAHKKCIYNANAEFQIKAPRSKDADEIFEDSAITRVLVICIVFLLFSEAYFVSCRMQFSMLIAYAYSRQNRINV